MKEKIKMRNADTMLIMVNGDDVVHFTPNMSWHNGRTTPRLLRVATVTFCALLLAGCHTTPATSRHSQPQRGNDRTVVPSVSAVESAGDLMSSLPIFPQPLSDIYSIYRLRSRFEVSLPVRRSQSSTPVTDPWIVSHLSGAESKEVDAMRHYQEQWDAYREGRRLSSPSLYPSRIDHLMQTGR
jgi:hypothetical protein